jgi:serine/threonine-protein kinase
MAPMTGASAPGDAAGIRIGRHGPRQFRFQAGNVPRVDRALTPDGHKGYVSINHTKDANASNRIGVVGVLDTTTNTIVKTISPGGWAHVPGSYAYGAEVTPDGKRLYVAAPGGVAVIDTATDTLTKKISVNGTPFWVALSGDGRRAYVAASDRLVVLDTATDSVIAEIPVDELTTFVAAHPGRPLVATSSSKTSTVTVIDASTNQVVVKVPVAQLQSDPAWSPGRPAPNPSEKNIVVIDAQTKEVANLPTGWSPYGLAVLSNGTDAYATSSDGSLRRLCIGG